MNRDDFPLLSDDIIYFDNSATSLKPKCVIDKMVEYYSKYPANAHRGDYDLSYKVDQEYEETRELVKDFINAEYLEEIIFTSGTTDSLNMIINGFFANLLEQNDEVLLTMSEHASNILPWYNLAQKKGIKINYVPLDNNYYLTMDNLKKTVTPNTKVISIAGITNVIGDIRPVKEICAWAHENNIFVILDGAQMVPHVRVDVKDLDVDFLAFSAHKMCGPTGVGVLYGKKELLEHLEPTTLGGGMNESFDNPYEVVLKELPTRLEAGTRNIAGVIGFKEAIKYLNNIGMENIHKYELDLRKYLINKLLLLKHIDIINIESDSGIVTFNVNNIFSQDVAYYLNKYNICVRAGTHCAKILKSSVGVSNTVRISLYFYNTYEEIDNLVELLSNYDKILKEMI